MATTVAYPDTLVGTDSHTTMVNGLGVLGWGVGGIEAEAAMLGQPVSMLIPEVVGFRLDGSLKEGITATDLVLTVTQMLRAKGVVGRFVEFYGPGLDALSLADRATIANMAPEYGATCGFFPIDERTIDYLKLTGRDADRIELVRAYAKAQGMWRDAVLARSLVHRHARARHVVGRAEPRRPQAPAGPRPPVRGRRAVQRRARSDLQEASTSRASRSTARIIEIGHGDVMIAAITSCTNTSNPSVLVAAGLVARKARALGLDSKPWVKTSLAPGQPGRHRLSRQPRASARTSTRSASTSSAMAAPPASAIRARSPRRCRPRSPTMTSSSSSVLSGNRNFEGRVSPDCRANYLASPPLVVAYALMGNVRHDMNNTPLGQGKDGQDVFLRDVWPTNDEVRELIDAHVHSDMFRSRYADVYHGDERWRAIEISGGETYNWPAASTYIQNPPYFEGMTMTPKPLTDISERGRWRCSAIRSPPTTSRRPARSRPTARRAPTSASIRCRAPNITAMARAAATTR